MKTCFLVLPLLMDGGNTFSGLERVVVKGHGSEGFPLIRPVFFDKVG